MSAPIFFMHRGNEPYLSFSLQQAKCSNPHAEVILIGKPANRGHGGPHVRHAFLGDYFAGAALFSNVYKHDSPNTREYNLFCFQRWFVLRDYMCRHGITEGYYLDSDVMLYANMRNSHLRRHPFELCWTTYVHIDPLKQLCEMMMGAFADPASFSHLRHHTRQLGHPAVSDMIAFDLFYSHVLGNTRTYGFHQDGLYDYNLHHCSGFEMQGGFKKIYWSGGALYGNLLAEHRFLRINSLHFQGGAKIYMSHFHTPHLPSGRNETFYFHYGAQTWVMSDYATAAISGDGMP
ncbi:hypothetical protein [Paenibacillus apiarius]|uniref:hypothetical protein n=1 Tax=Paenibacillus apiarius TaxID=46240 RepID=UPI003B3B66C6